MRTSRCAFIWACLLCALGASAQVYVPSKITLETGVHSNRAKISWTTIPGKNYDVLTAEQPGQPWAATDVTVKARSTLTNFTDPANRLMRLYRIREQATPPGNTGSINATTIAETEKLLGLTFTASQRNQMLQLLFDSSYWANRAAFESMRTNRLLNSDPPALLFNPLPQGFTFDPAQKPIVWSPAQHLALPTNLSDLAFYSVGDLGELIRTRQLTSSALTQFCLERLKRYDSNLFCVITLTEELALQQAAHADAEIAAGIYRGPLHGIPYGVKDLFSTKTYRTTWGAAPFQDQVIDEDATIIRRLEAAGAVLAVKLSLGELAQRDVWFGGQTRNPWSPGEGSSGSSAGSAAATAAGLVPFAIGTETLGSIVFPCTVCRMTGLRPTFGRVSRAGAMTLSWSMDKTGPICRTVEDCALVLEAIRGADGVDEAAVDAPFNYDPRLDLTALRVGYRAGIPSVVTNRLAAIVGPAQLVSIALPRYPNRALSLLILDAEAAAALDPLTRFGADAFLADQGDRGWPNRLRTARTIPAAEYLQANRLRHKLIQDMGALMRTVDLFVDVFDFEQSGYETLYVSNLTGQPCVVLPNGGATSLNVIGKLYDEATVLAFAKAYQDATGFHTNRPPQFVQ